VVDSHVAAQHVGFVAICLFLTVPECTHCFRSTDHRTLHSINARTAFYTMAVGALVKSCAKMLDCTEQPDGTSTLDVLPDTVCWQGVHAELLAPLGAVGLIFYAVLVPLKLFVSLRDSAKDRKWTEDELEKHAWLILKVRGRANSPLVALVVSIPDLRCVESSTSRRAGGSSSRCSTTRSSSSCSPSF